MNELEFKGWLETRYPPSTARTYLSDMRRVERRSGSLHALCVSGEVDSLIDEIRQSGERAENKSYRSEIQAIRTYIRFLDDHLCAPAPDTLADASPAPIVSAATPSAPEAQTPSTADGGCGSAISYSGGYWHPAIFPREAFVQKSIQDHFLQQGFHRVPGGHADWVCQHPASGQRWHIECKGLTTAVGLDFRTGLGQLLQAMQINHTHYAIAVPDIPAFTRQIDRMDPAFISHLGLQFLLVDSHGKVTQHS